MTVLDKISGLINSVELGYSKNEILMDLNIIYKDIYELTK